jgi:hypothetical protein
MGDDGKASDQAARDELRQLFRDFPRIYQPQRYNVKGGRLVGQETDGTETHLIAEDYRQHCPKCGKHRFHDVYCEIGGAPVITCRTFAHCRDCGHESEGKNPEPVGELGDVTPAEQGTGRLKSTRERKIRRQAQRKARRKART